MSPRAHRHGRHRRDRRLEAHRQVSRRRAQRDQTRQMEVMKAGVERARGQAVQAQRDQQGLVEGVAAVHRELRVRMLGTSTSLNAPALRREERNQRENDGRLLEWTSYVRS
jgi:hypothetical protein